MHRCLFLLVSVCLYFGCQHTQNIDIAKGTYSEEQIDSILEAFEIHADENPELYLHDPAAFLNSIHVSPETPFQKTAYANGIIFMAYTLRDNGENLESIKYYEKALNYIQENDIWEIDINTYIVKPLANLYVRIDDNDKAIRLLEAAMPSIKNTEEKNSFLIALANSYLFYGSTTKSKELLLDVIQNTKISLPKALAYNILASVYKTDEDIINSIKYNSLALKEFEKNSLRDDSLMWYTSALALYGELHHDNTSINQAMNLLEQHFPSSQQRVKARYALANGDVYQEKRKLPEAQQHYKRTIQLLTQDQQPYTLDYTYTRALFGIAQCYEHEYKIDSALHYYQWAIENDFRTQQLITGKTDQLKNNKWHKKMVEQMVDLIERRLTLPNADENKLKQQLLWCIELSKARLLINEINRSELWESSSIETKQAIQKIRDLYIRQDQTNDSQEKKNIQAQIDKLLVDFQLSEKYFETLGFNPDQKDFFANLNRLNTDYYSYFIHEDKQVSIVSKVNDHYYYDRVTDTGFISEVDRFKSTYFGNSPEEYRNSPKQYHASSQQIAQKLLPNIGDKGKNIYASLDGSLYGLPLDALWDHDFLISRYNFAYLNSFLLFDLLSSEKSTDHKITLLYRSTYPDPLPDLDFVPKEVKSISKSFKTRIVPPEQQRDTVISDVFAASDVVHIAAHTLLDKENQAPLIYLERMISTNQIRFYQMNTPLVFLSACNTGSGLALPSEGMESIQRVFLGKGVPSVISTYWFANDQVMLQLTSDFYQQLAESGQPATALALAKRNYLAQADSEQLNPWYWANINYTGVGNEIGLKKSSNLSTCIYGFLLASLLGLAYFWWRRSRFDRSFIEIDQKPYN